MGGVQNTARKSVCKDNSCLAVSESGTRSCDDHKSNENTRHSSHKQQLTFGDIMAIEEKLTQQFTDQEKITEKLQASLDSNRKTVMTLSEDIAEITRKMDQLRRMMTLHEAGQLQKPK